ncbi:hypothetical protein SERLA73DRAFT_27800, partial [Serpula lacrymans var. lacrymans S7.3]
WQCTECLGKPEYCMSYCRDAHQRLPFHRVEQWVGTHFEPSWLYKAGLVIHLGYTGKPFP